ncbi:MAG: hypothetical protein L0191_20135 [Acidobacteria bacterium]|nr:hypothetical protein [Acidobacteriota bacterium]
MEAEVAAVAGDADVSMKHLVAFAILIVSCSVALAQTDPTPPPAPPSVKDKFFYGGGLGLSFGDVDYVEIAPLVGYRFLPKLDGGVQPFYRWVNDSRYAEDVTTADYGMDLFVRYFVVPTIFVQGEYEFLNYEYVLPTFQTERDTTNSFLAGGGFSQPIGKGAGFFVSVLYNFSYDSSDPTSPYGDAWQVQAGVIAGF